MELIPVPNNPLNEEPFPTVQLKPHYQNFRTFPWVLSMVATVKESKGAVGLQYLGRWDLKRSSLSLPIVDVAQIEGQEKN